MSIDPKQVVAAVQAAGADQAQVSWTQSTKHELNAEWGEVSLLRTTFDRQLELVAVVDQCRATLTLNDTSETAVDEAVNQVVELAKGSRPDPVNALLPGTGARTFESGPSEPDLETMCVRLEEFLAHREATWPSVSLRGVHLDFTRADTVLVSSEGVDLRSVTGAYQAVVVFSARDGVDVSSFNYSVWQGRDLSQPLHELGSFARLLSQSQGQLHPQRVPDKFVGTVVVTPDCLPSFLGPFAQSLGDSSLVAGTSMYRDSLRSQVTDDKLTIHCRPASERRGRPDFFTKDGRVAADSTLVERGVLQGFLLSDRGATRTGLPRGDNEGGGYEIDPGDTPLDELISGIERGVLLCRFSGGRPSDNGDFSGVAKNSYLIEDGKVQTPLGETMVSGNFVRMLKEVRGVSAEHTDFGFCDLPWVAFEGLTVS